MTKDTEEVKLANVMVRDGGAPNVVRSGEGTLMSATLNSLYAKLGLDRSYIPLISSNRREVKRVIDAKLGGPCRMCGEQVWLSPSSLTTGLQVAIVCWLCVVKEASQLVIEFGVTSFRPTLPEPSTAEEALPSR